MSNYEIDPIRSRNDIWNRLGCYWNHYVCSLWWHSAAIMEGREVEE